MTTANHQLNENQQIGAIKLMFLARLEDNCTKIARRLANTYYQGEKLLALSKDLFLSEVAIVPSSPKLRHSLREHYYVGINLNLDIEEVISHAVKVYCKDFCKTYYIDLSPDKMDDIVNKLRRF